MVRVESEAIAEMDYDAATLTLYVRFVEGDWYRYLSVPVYIYAKFLAADSHGHFFHEHIRDRYPYHRGR